MMLTIFSAIKGMRVGVYNVDRYHRIRTSSSRVQGFLARRRSLMEFHAHKGQAKDHVPNHSLLSLFIPSQTVAVSGVTHVKAQGSMPSFSEHAR